MRYVKPVETYYAFELCTSLDMQHRNKNMIVGIVNIALDICVESRMFEHI